MTRESWASSSATRRAMRANRSRDTGPEVAVRRELHRRGLRYRVAARPEPEMRRTADVLFTKQKIAVFIDGCFWHGCPIHHRLPSKNREYWLAKVSGNAARDLRTDEALAARGWVVLRFWEHDDPIEVASQVEAAVKAPRP